MEPGISVDDQFSKLHPCFPPDSRIAIVGAGPSGLAAAYALCKLGYSDVTVFEKERSPGGMCESVDIEGRIYDLGGQVLAANSAPTVFHLAREIAAETEEMDTHKFALIDSSTGALSEMKLVEDYVSMISLTLKLQDKAKESGRIGVHAVSEIAPDLTPEYLKGQGFQSVPKSVIYGYTASGYGYVQDMPYAYIHEFTRTSMAGKIRRFKGGYMSVWKKLSEYMPINFYPNTEVLSVKRNSSSIRVDVKNESGDEQVMAFDKIIISGAFPFNNGKVYRSPSSDITEFTSNRLDMSELERELFSKVQTIDYYTTVLKIKGLEHIPKGFYYFDKFMDDPAAIGNPVAMQRFYEETNIFLFWSYGNSTNIQGSKVEELAMNAVISMGGQIEKVVLQRRFKYFPHVNSDDMKDGFYNKLEFLLQGQQNTYFVGGLMAFELTERNSNYAMELVRKHFANDNPVPSYPYVKALLTLKPNRTLVPKQLDESPGIQFPDLSSLDAYLQYWGSHSATQSKTLYTWINEKGHVTAQRTYKELHNNASEISYKLLTSQKPTIKPGDRVLLIYIPGLDFVDAFFGCLRAGVIPVPTIPPEPSQKGGQALLHVENIAKACNAVAILSTLSYHITVMAASARNMVFLKGNSKCSPRWPDLPWLYTDSWVKKAKFSMSGNDVLKIYEPSSDDLCFLQYTSGSTGDAKGVMITHAGLIHNVKLMRRRYRSTSNTILVSWLPQYHDMGLIGGLFTSMVSGGSAILFSPLTFIRSPLLWLQTISTYHATHTAGPNFAFELLIRRLESSKTHSFDLSSMIFLMIAAEPVRAATLRKFLKLTQSFGLSQEVLSPGYGLAENSVYVSSAYGEGKEIMVDWQDRVCCGYVNPDDEDVDIKVVDPETGIELSEKEGEIWIRSPSSGVGYWGMEELSQKTFRNEIYDHPGKKYMRTGDLGRIIDGKLFITGRIKDLIIVAGRNIYSSDIENTVESSSELIRPGCCAAVGVPKEILLSKGISVHEITDQVGLVVIAEIREVKPVLKEIMRQIQTCVAEEHGIVAASIVLIKPRSISKTTSGKIKRFECLKKFADGTLDTVDQLVAGEKSQRSSMENITQPQVKPDRPSVNSSISKREIINFLKELLSEMSGISTVEISATESLVSYGIDSIGVVRAAQKLSYFLGVSVGAIDIFTATCIEDLASFAENLLKKSRPQSVASSTHSTETKYKSSTTVIKDSSSHKLGIWLLQLIALAYVSFLLMFPAYLSVSIFSHWMSTGHRLMHTNLYFSYLISLACAPLAWILCIFFTSISIAFFGSSFLQPNYALDPEISIWSVEFAKWWALHKVQEVSSKVLAVHLRGTVFINYWFRMLGAKIPSSTLLDTIDITDPFLVSIGEEAVLAEGVMIQSHEMKNGILNLYPTRIGSRSSVGPYALIQKGAVVEDGAEILALNSGEGGNSKDNVVNAESFQKGKTVQQIITKNSVKSVTIIQQFFGIYMIGFLSSLSAAMSYSIYLWILQKPPSFQHFTFFCVSGAFHWLPYTIVAYTVMFTSIPSNSISFAIAIAMAYAAYGLLLCFFTCILKYCILGKQELYKAPFRTFLLRQIMIACHVRFTKFITGTEAFCAYLRCLGAKVGRHCSIRAINPVSHPELISVADGVHLGDFSKIIPGYYTSNGYVAGNIEIQDNSVVGSQSLVLPGSVLEEDVILGALSVSPMSSVLQSGGVFVGSPTPVMVKNTVHSFDDRIEEMDMKYKKVLGNLAANLAGTTLKVRSRYFHRIGAAGKGFLRLYDNIPTLPDHEIFSPGKQYSIVIRHSNCLSSDDDARLDPRGAAIRVLSSNDEQASPLLDLTLKTGNAFHARTIGDFATWLVCGSAAREEHVKHAPHIRDAMWSSLRRADSYTELHYYSNICRLFRFKDGQEMYVKFKLRPFDKKFDEDTGKVEPRGILPPETGAIPRDEKDERPLLFLKDDFQRRVNSPEKVRYVLQLQTRSVPDDESTRENALDITKPWDETEFPVTDVGEITIDKVLTTEESEELEFNPFLRCREVDVIRATSCNQSASMDHGRSIVYTICQHLRNKKPLPEAWKMFLDQSDVKVDLSGCPMAAAFKKKDAREVTLARPWYVTLWLMSGQPFLQTFLPYFLMGLVIFAPLNLIFYINKITKTQMYWLLPIFWISSGILGGIVCAVSKWILVGRKKDGKVEPIWSAGIFMDTTWQAIRTLVGEYFMEMTGGSFLFGIWMKLMGAEIAWDEGVYVDSMGALLNPELVRIEEYGSVEREALLFGHIYEGEGGNVKYGKIVVRKDGFIGSRAVAMPGVTVDTGGRLRALSLAMKEEFVK
ncbi:4-coumarate--CoA ligase [Abeliophyllum distichum]|uniref:4-coumarate--CoA ligase n=1 Tax=Abeliophyllum distichum TaxID=126358 RepID=A0ABD1Q2S8_9LAMI